MKVTPKEVSSKSETPAQQKKYWIMIFFKSGNSSAYWFKDREDFKDFIDRQGSNIVKYQTIKDQD